MVNVTTGMRRGMDGSGAGGRPDPVYL
jgi:hypothetical protein